MSCYPHHVSRQRAEEAAQAAEAAAGGAEAGVAAAGGGAAMHCVRCTDAWRDREQEEWSFSCVCGRNEGATSCSFEAPSGRMFECNGCGRWAHTEYARMVNSSSWQRQSRPPTARDALALAHGGPPHRASPGRNRSRVGPAV